MTDEPKLLWPPIDPHVRHQYDKAEIKMFQNKEGKPVFKVIFGDTGHAVYMTETVAQLITDKAATAKKIYEKAYS